MGLTKVLPQRVEHSDGWAVANAGRERVKYEEAGRTAYAGIDRGRPSSRLYVDSLAWADTDPAEPIVEPERTVVLERLVEGLKAIGEHEIELY